MDIVLVVRNLGAQRFRHLACVFCVLPAFHDKQVVFQVVVDGANPFFIFHFFLIVCKLLLKLGNLHFVPLFLIPEIGHISGIQKLHNENYTEYRRNQIQ